MTKSDLNMDGFTPLTSVDYADWLAAVIFRQACPMRCRYRHNQDRLPRQ